MKIELLFYVLYIFWWNFRLQVSLSTLYISVHDVHFILEWSCCWCTIHASVIFLSSNWSRPWLTYSYCVYINLSEGLAVAYSFRQNMNITGVEINISNLFVHKNQCNVHATGLTKLSLALIQNVKQLTMLLNYVVFVAYTSIKRSVFH